MNDSLEKYRSKNQINFFNRKKISQELFFVISLCFLCISLQLCGQTAPPFIPFHRDLHIFGQHQDSLLPSVALFLPGIKYNA